MKRALFIGLALSSFTYGNEDLEKFSVKLDPETLEMSQQNEGRIICVSPAFPKDENGNPLEGEVLLSLSIDANGKPEKVLVSKSSGDERIDEVAVQNAKLSVFKESLGKSIEKKFIFELEK